jgi:hypothetical protein
MAKRGTVNGHFSPTPRLRNVPGDDLAEQPGKDVSKEVDRDYPIRGGRPDRNETGR